MLGAATGSNHNRKAAADPCSLFNGTIKAIDPGGGTQNEDGNLHYTFAELRSRRQSPVC